MPRWSAERGGPGAGGLAGRYRRGQAARTPCRTGRSHVRTNLVLRHNFFNIICVTTKQPLLSGTIITRTLC